MVYGREEQYREMATHSPGLTRRVEGSSDEKETPSHKHHHHQHHHHHHHHQLAANTHNQHKKSSTGSNKFRFMNERAKPGHAYIPTKVEHIANMVTHGLWIPPSVLGLVWMLQMASTQLQTTISLIYGVSILLLFSISTAFHTISYSGHCGLALRDYGGWGILTLWVVWIAAVVGIAYQYTFHEQYKWLETLLYLVIGVCPSVVTVFMNDPTTGLTELAMGGGVYIMGVVFFKSDGLIPFAHAIWHCFVSVGAMFHFLAVCVHLLGSHNELDIHEFSR